MPRIPGLDTRGARKLPKAAPLAADLTPERLVRWAKTPAEQARDARRTFKKGLARRELAFATLQNVEE